MTFEEATREAARKADEAVERVLKKQIRRGLTRDEDDLTGIFVGAIELALTDEIGGLRWSSSILRHRRGIAAQERRIGADILIHVEMDTNIQKYSKGVLVQAKRIGPDRTMKPVEKKRLVNQCERMLEVSAASFVFDYGNGVTRCGSATRVAGASSFDLYKTCGWTLKRFLLELFRCPIGDPRIASARVEDIDREYDLEIAARGSLDSGDEPPYLTRRR